MYRIILEPEVKFDIRDAYEYYEKQQPGLGERFNHEVISQIDTLPSSPFFQIRYTNIRCKPMATFPFLIHYEVHQNEQTIVIKGVFHTSLSPRGWNRD